MPFLKIHSTLPCKCFVFFDYVGEQWGVSFCFQTIKHELGFRKRVVSTVEHRRGGKYSFRGHPSCDPQIQNEICLQRNYRMDGHQLLVYIEIGISRPIHLQARIQ